MKRISKLFTAAALLFTVQFGAASASAQEKSSSKQIVVAEYATTLSCSMCEKRIMNVIPFQKGVRSVVVDVPTKVVTVEYDSSKCNDEAIIAGFKKVNLDAERIEKSEE